MHLSEKRRRWGMSTGAAIVAVALAGIGAAVAIASTFTLRVVKNVHDTNAQFANFAVKPVNTNEAVAVGPAGFAVYTFQGETTHHLICKKTNSAATNCWGFWPPVSQSSGRVTKAAGISGTLGTFRNHGMRQVTLNGQPLYYFAPDLMSGNKRKAQGDELKTFGSIWHVVKAHVAAAQNAPQSTGAGSGSPAGW